MEEEILRRLEAIGAERQAQIERTEEQLNTVRDEQDRREGQAQLEAYRSEYEQISRDITMYRRTINTLESLEIRRANAEARRNDTLARIERTEAQSNTVRDEQDRREGQAQLEAYRSELASVESELTDIQTAVERGTRRLTDIEVRYNINRADYSRSTSNESPETTQATNDIDSQIARLEEQRRAAAERRSKYRRAGNTEGEAREASEMTRLSAQIAELRSRTSNESPETTQATNDIDSQIARLEEQRRAAAERRSKYRRAGNTEGEAREASEMTRLSAQIAELRARENPSEPTNTDVEPESRTQEGRGADSTVGRDENGNIEYPPQVRPNNDRGTQYPPNAIPEPNQNHRPADPPKVTRGQATVPAPEPTPNPEPIHGIELHDPEPTPNPVPTPNPEPIHGIEPHDPEPTPNPDPTPNPELRSAENPNLPVVSGLQIYNRVLQEVGYIKGTKAIKVHDVMSHVALIGKPVAWIIEKFTGRKKEQQRIIDAMEGIDFESEYGIDQDEAVDKMIHDCLLKDGKRSVTKLKVNDIFLRALKQKLIKDMPRKVQYAQDTRSRYMSEIAALEEERKTADPTRIDEIDTTIGKYHTWVDGCSKVEEYLSDEISDIEAARVAKSYDKASNIEGRDAAVRDIDSREAISGLAAIEKKKLIAEREGRVDDANKYMYEMAKYMDSQTVYKKAFIGKGKVSIGAFESPMGEPKIMSDKDNLVMKSMTAIGMGLTFGALSLKRQLDSLGDMMVQHQQAEFKLDRAIDEAQRRVDQQTMDANALSGQVRDTQGIIGEREADNAVQAVKKPAIDSIKTGERSSEHAGFFNESNPDYIATDAQNVQFSTANLRGADTFIEQHPSDGLPAFQRYVDSYYYQTRFQEHNLDLIRQGEQNAQAYYGDVSNLISHAGVDHGRQALAEQFEAVAAEQADIDMGKTAVSVLQSLGRISAKNFDKIDLRQYVDVSSIIEAFKTKGIDILSVVAPSIVAADRAARDGIDNKEKGR